MGKGEMDEARQRGEGYWSSIGGKLDALHVEVRDVVWGRDDDMERVEG